MLAGNYYYCTITIKYLEVDSLYVLSSSSRFPMCHEIVVNALVTLYVQLSRIFDHVHVHRLVDGRQRETNTRLFSVRKSSKSCCFAARTFVVVTIPTPSISRTRTHTFTDLSSGDFRGYINIYVYI